VPTPEEDLAPYEPTASEPWTRAAAAHLLRRAGFGGSRGEIETAFAAGPRRTVDLLVRPAENPAYREARGSVLPLLDFADVSILQAGWLLRMLAGGDPFREKLALFWHGHFATSNRKVADLRLMHAQNLLFLEKGTGRFRDLALAVARDPAMLVWLDGDENEKGRPNENLAREWMELFTLGIGNFGEADVREAARAFTGWHARRGAFSFDVRAHDAGEKTVLGSRGPLDGKGVVDLCVERDACFRLLARKLFSFYVYPDPSPPLVEALAVRLRTLDGGIGPFVEALLRSRALFRARSRRALVKSPVELAVGTLRALELRPDARALGALLREMGQSLFEPPDVKGWEGGRAWISASSLLARNRFAAEVAGIEEGPLGCALDPDAFFPLSVRRSPEETVDFALEALLQGGVPPAVRERLVVSTREGDPVEARPRLVHAVLALPEHQMN
jgi:uncharacterized protein (DUF1800 family)